MLAEAGQGLVAVDSFALESNVTARLKPASPAFKTRSAPETSLAGWQTTSDVRLDTAVSPLVREGPGAPAAVGHLAAATLEPRSPALGAGPMVVVPVEGETERLAFVGEGGTEELAVQAANPALSIERRLTATSCFVLIRLGRLPDRLGSR